MNGFVVNKDEDWVCMGVGKYLNGDLSVMIDGGLECYFMLIVVCNDFFGFNWVFVDD